MNKIISKNMYKSILIYRYADLLRKTLKPDFLELNNDNIKKILKIIYESKFLSEIILSYDDDRILKTFYYTNSINTNYSMTILRVSFYDYFTNTITDSTYQYQIRLIKENIGAKRQFVEVYVISSPPSPGYSTAINTYPSGNVDTNGNTIDTTKNSPYNITNGTIFLNPCGSTYSTSSPTANTSFVFSSDSTGTSWVFNNNSYVSV